MLFMRGPTLIADGLQKTNSRPSHAYATERDGQMWAPRRPVRERFAPPIHNLEKDFHLPERHSATPHHQGLIWLSIARINLEILWQQVWQ